MKLGFPVLCIDSLIQIKPAIQTIIHWTPGKLFPEEIGAKVLELEMTTLLSGQESLNDTKDFGDTFESEALTVLACFHSLDKT